MTRTAPLDTKGDLHGGADNTALYCIDDDAQAALVSLSDVHEIQCNWYLAFFLRSQ